MTKDHKKSNVRAIMSLLLGIAFVVSCLAAFDRWSSYYENRSSQRLMELAVKSSSLVHELQKERGMSAGFLKSGGKNFSSAILDQRLFTDSAITTYFSFIKSSKIREKRGFVDGLVETYLSLVKSLNADNSIHMLLGRTNLRIMQVSQTRKQVSSQKISLSGAIDFYTKLNASLLSINLAISGITSDQKIRRQLAAYDSFLQGKERAGIERAIGAAGYGGGFSTTLIDKFNQLIGVQQTRFAEFRVNALPGNLRIFDSSMGDPAVIEVNRLREIARASVTSGDRGGIKAQYWFATITKKINILKSIENKLSDSLLLKAVSNKDKAFDIFQWMGMFAAVAGFLFLLIRVYYAVKEE